MNYFVCFFLFFSSNLFAWSLAGGNIGGWPQRNIPVYYNASACSISEAELISLIDQAIATWNSTPTTGLNLFRSTASTVTVAEFLSVGGPSPLVVCDPLIGVRLQVDANGVPAATRLTLDSNSRVNSAGVIINAQFGAGANFGFLSRPQQMVTLTHELGHALGLGHSESPHSLMYYSIDNKTAPILTEDDMDGMTYLYPRGEFSANPFGCSAVHFARSTVSLVWMWVFCAMSLVGMLVTGRFLMKRNSPPQNQT